MKHFTVLLAVFAMIIGASLQAAPKDPPVSVTEKNATLIEKNLVSLFESDNFDLRVGAIQTVLDIRRCCPDMDLDYTIIPLLGCLRDESSPELRVMAATALFELNTHLGKYAVERRALYDSNEWAARQFERITQAWDLHENKDYL